MKLIWSDAAIKQLKKLERHVAKRIYKKVGRAAEKPRHYVRRLTNSEFFKVRIGDYRAIIDITKNRVEVLRVGHRSTIYKNLL